MEGFFPEGAVLSKQVVAQERRDHPKMVAQEERIAIGTPEIRRCIGTITRGITTATVV